MTRIVKSSGNVFEDLGFSPADAEDLQLRSDLLVEVQKRIASLKRTQGAIAASLGITQPRVSDLLCGKIEKFSSDALAGFLRRLGARVHVSVHSESALAKLRREVAEANVDAFSGVWGHFIATRIVAQAAPTIAASDTELRMVA